MIILKILVAYLVVGVLCGITYILGVLYVMKTIKGYKEDFRELMDKEIGKLINTTTECSIAVLIAIIVLFYPFIVADVIEHWND